MADGGVRPPDLVEAHVQVPQLPALQLRAPPPMSAPAIAHRLRLQGSRGCGYGTESDTRTGAVVWRGGGDQGGDQRLQPLRPQKVAAEPQALEARPVPQLPRL
eukprot:3283636-Rhodomonas_salina.1